MDCSPSGCSVYGILQARILELPFPSPGDLPDPGIEPETPVLAGKFFTTEPPEKAFKEAIILIIIINVGENIY